MYWIVTTVETSKNFASQLKWLRQASADGATVDGVSKKPQEWSFIYFILSCSFLNFSPSCSWLSYSYMKPTVFPLFVFSIRIWITCARWCCNVYCKLHSSNPKAHMYNLDVKVNVHMVYLMLINFATQSLKPEELQKSNFTFKHIGANPFIFDGVLTSLKFCTNCLLYKAFGIL